MLAPIAPVFGPTSSIMLLIEGCVGAVVSTTTLKPAVALLVLPAASVAVTVKVCDPFVSGVVGVNDQLLLLCTSAVPSRVLPS